MNNKILISIIVPLYNCEKFISDCIESLLNQTYDNVEIIIVNDGSKDNSLEIAKQFQQKDKRVKVLDQKNQGANAARNTGIKNASGDYCMFVDADDWLELNAVETLVNKLNNTDYDIIKFIGIIEPIKKIKNKFNFNGNDCEDLDYPYIYDLLINTKILNNLCFSIYKKELLLDNEALNSNLSNSEDFWANLEIYCKKPKIAIINNILYHYRSNENSTTRTKSKERVLKNINERIFVYEKLFDYIKKWNIDTQKYKNNVAFTIIDATRESLFSLIDIDNINKKELKETISDILNKEIFKYIRNNIKYSDIKTILHNKSLYYRLRNGITIKSIYFKRVNLIYLNKYLLKIYNLKKRK